MPLYVSNAGNSAYNGTYADSGTTHNGYPVYADGAGHYVYNGLHSGWSINGVVDDNATPAYYGGGSGANPNTAAGAYVGSGTPPAPTVSGYTGGGGSMPLPASLTVSGAGNSSFNGTDGHYSKQLDQYNSSDYYRGGTGGSCYLYYQSGTWYLVYNAQPGSGTPTYKRIGSSPVGTWTMLDGSNTGTDSPAPTVVDSSGGTGGGTNTMSFTGTVFEGTFLSPESALGTLPGSPVYYGLQSLTMNLQPNTPVNDVEAQGVVLPVGVTREKEMTDVDYSMDLSFNDILYMLAGVVCIPYAAQDASHPTVYYYDNKPKANNPDAFQTYNGIEGQTLGASGCPGVHFNSADFTFEEKKASLTGKGFGQILDDTVSQPGTPTIVPLIPIDPASLNVYMASSFAGLSAGQLSDVEGMKLTIPERKTPIKTRDSRVQTYSGVVQKRIAPSGQIVVDKNTSSAGFMTTLRSRGTAYCRIEYVGPQIGSTGINYRLAIDFALKFKKSSRSDQQDQFVSTFDFGLTRDPNFLGGSWINFQVTTDLTPTSLGITTQAGALGAGSIPTTASASAEETAASQQ